MDQNCKITGTIKSISTPTDLCFYLGRKAIQHFLGSRYLSVHGLKLVQVLEYFLVIWTIMCPSDFLCLCAVILVEIYAIHFEKLYFLLEVFYKKIKYIFLFNTAYLNNITIYLKKNLKKKKNNNKLSAKNWITSHLS